MTQHSFSVDKSTGLVDGIRFAPSPNADERPDGCDVCALIIHNISLPPESFGGDYVEQFFCNQLDCTIHPYFQTIAELRVSAHFLIQRDGAITQFVSTQKRAWHAGQSEFLGRSRVNDFSVGIELEGSDTRPFNPVQYPALAALTNALVRTYPAITAANIAGHSDIAPGRKTDPGPYFDWRVYRALLDR